MIRRHQNLLITLCALFALMPAIAPAQANHCVAQKSALRMAFEAGQTLYASKCQTCHQADGSGLPGMNPSLIKSKQIGGDQAPLIELMVRGHQPAAGTAAYNQTMPVYADLSNEEIAQLLTYIRRSFGNKGSLIKPSAVEEQRGK